MYQKNNVIVIASGNSACTAELAEAYIKSYLSEYRFDKVALVIPLDFTPFHSNTPIKPDCLNVEQALIKPRKDFKKYILKHPHPVEIENEECKLSKLEYQYICVSTKYSVQEQAVNLSKLFLDSWEMPPENTFINVVNFGGSILTNGEQSAIAAPDINGYILALTDHLDKYLRKISVCFPGADGELPIHYLIEYTNKNSVRKDSIDVNKWSSALSAMTTTTNNSTTKNIVNIISTLQHAQKYKIKPNACWDHRKTLPAESAVYNWILGEKTFSISKDITFSWDLQPFIYTFDVPIENPYTAVYNDESESYDLGKIVNAYTKIYKTQHKHENTVQGSSLHLQYLRNDLYGRWSNKQVIYPANPKEKCIQEVMLVDVFPHFKQNEKTLATKEIKNLQASNAFNTLYTQSIKIVK